MARSAATDTARPPALGSEEIAPGVFALGGWERADDSISWLTKESEGWLPFNCYLIKEGREGLLIDGGVAAHEQQVLDQLDEVGGDLQNLEIFISRFVEFDSIGNAAAIVAHRPVRRLYAHYPDVEHVDEQPQVGVDYLRVGAHLDGAVADPELTCIQIDEGGTRVAVGERELVLRRAALRLLLCAWTFDPKTGTLFTSDAFGHTLIGDPQEGRVVEAATDHTTVADVRAGLRGKFDWLFTANPEPTRRLLTELFDAFEVEAIAPAWGAVISGRELVERHVAMLLEVLSEIEEGHDDV